jgi:diadenosine tetraphosphate (Ap4A) HIT family hydrolase
MLAPDQGYLGRSYVTLRDHKGHLAALSWQEWGEYANIVLRLERACVKALNATLFNWSCLLNNAYQKTPHTPMCTDTFGRAMQTLKKLAPPHLTILILANTI